MSHPLGRKTARFGTAVVLASVATLGLAGCSKGHGDGTVTVHLGGLSDLEARVPAKTRVAENAVGIGVMLKGPDVSMTIGPARDIDASDLEGAKKIAEAYSPSDLQGETLADGYILTYESQGKEGTLYWLTGHRELEGTDYVCGVRSPKKAHQQSAIAICKSLKK